MAEFAHSSPDTIQRDVQQARSEATSGDRSSDVKYGKDEVNYRPAGSSNTRCERCSNFKWSSGLRGAGTCRIVAGSIKGSYVCDKFTSGGGGLMDLVTNEPTR